MAIEIMEGRIYFVYFNSTQVNCIIIELLLLSLFYVT